jgi:hypothetical protein
MVRHLHKAKHMRHELNKWTFLAIVASVGLGCGKSNLASGDAGVQETLPMAEAIWAAAKPSCPNYHYEALTWSFTGFCTKTTIQIASDEPVRRSFMGGNDGCGGTDAGPTETWDEVGALQIGTHADGASALTAEQLFAACQTSLAQDPSTNTLTLTIGAEGVPTRCGFTPINCADDCYMGFELSDVTCGSLPADGGSADGPN